MNYIVCGIVGYIIGSIPTAYILLKKIKSVDITKNGSSNVGALNSYKVSQSKLIGVSVLLIDLIKGFTAVWLMLQLFGNNFFIGGITILFAVIGHNYSPWIGFKGGRGLATTAGGAIALSIPVLILWLIFWAVSYLFKKNIHLSNIMATLLTGAIALTSAKNINNWSAYPLEEPLWFGIIVAAIMVVILSRHIEPFKQFLQNQKQLIRKN